MDIISKVIYQYKNLSVVAKSSLWFTICNLLVKGISLITTPIFTRILSTNEYGLLSQYVSIQQLVLMIATWDISYGAYQKGLFKYKDNIIIFTNAATLFTSICSIVTFGILFEGYRYLEKYILLPKKILFLLFIYVLFQPAYRNWTVYKQKDYKYKPVIASSFIITIGSVLCSLFSLMFLQADVNTKMVSELLWSIVIFLPFYISSLNIKLLLNNIDKVIMHLKFIITFQFPYVLHSLSLVILGQADRLMIGNFIGNSEAALYSIAYNLANLMSIIQLSLEQAMKPWRYRKIEEKNYDAIKKNTNILLVLIGIIMCMFVIVAPEIMKIMFTKDYYEAIWCIPPVVLGVYFTFLYSIFVSIETYYEKTWYILFVSIVCSLVNIVLNYYVIKPFGYIACSYTTLVSYILFAFGHYLFARKILVDNDSDSMFDVKGILFISFLIAIMIFGCMLVYDYVIIRYCILLGICVFCFVFRKRIKEMVSLIKENNISIRD